MNEDHLVTEATVFLKSRLTGNNERRYCVTILDTINAKQSPWFKTKKQALNWAAEYYA